MYKPVTCNIVHCTRNNKQETRNKKQGTRNNEPPPSPMCYETALTKMKSQVQAYFRRDFAQPEDYNPYYHHSGFDHPILQIIKMDEPNLIYSSQWGYVPSWGKSDIPAFRKKYNTLNIRSENLFKGITKESAQSGRCLIIADGFFEPHKVGGMSIPYFCYIPSNTFADDRHLFAFCGIYSEMQKDSDQFTCSILTMEANSFFSEVHNVKKRQPLVLDEGLYKEWLSPDLREKEVLELMKNGFTSKEFRAYPVSQDLYRRGIDTNNLSILEEVPPPGLLF